MRISDQRRHSFGVYAYLHKSAAPLTTYRSEIMKPQGYGFGDWLQVGNAHQKQV